MGIQDHTSLKCKDVLRGWKELHHGNWCTFRMCIWILEILVETKEKAHSESGDMGPLLKIEMRGPILSKKWMFQPTKKLPRKGVACDLGFVNVIEKNHISLGG